MFKSNKAKNKGNYGMHAKILITGLLALQTHSAFGCQCINTSALSLYDESQIVVLASAADDFDHNRQGIIVNELIKGGIPEGGLFISQQLNSCLQPQLPMPRDREHLLFIAKSGSHYKLTSRCHNDTDKNGYYDLLQGDEVVNIHRNMLSTYFKYRGKKPELELFTSYISRDDGVESVLGIVNKTGSAVELYHPSNKNAFTFYVTAPDGDHVQAQAIAALKPTHEPLTLPASGIYNHKTTSAIGMMFPYPSVEDRRGYTLQSNKTYSIHVIYRPYGGTYGAVFSKEEYILRN